MSDALSPFRQALQAAAAEAGLVQCPRCQVWVAAPIRWPDGTCHQPWCTERTAEIHPILKDQLS